MNETLISGEITLFGTDNKPLFALRKNADGEWDYQTFRQTETTKEERIPLSSLSAQRLQKFMVFHA